MASRKKWKHAKVKEGDWKQLSANFAALDTVLWALTRRLARAERKLGLLPKKPHEDVPPAPPKWPPK